jgi:hypothetical protein
MRILLGTLLIVVLAAGTVQAENVFGVAWTPVLPTGNTDGFASGLSLRGASLEMRSFLNPTVAWGGSVGWDVFNEEFSGTETLDEVTVTGKAWNYINAVPVHLGIFKYTSESRRDRRVYFGLHAGATWIERRTDFSILSRTEQRWHFSVAPEVGVQMPWNTFLGYLGVRFHHAFPSGDVEAQDWFEFKIGFGLG